MEVSINPSLLISPPFVKAYCSCRHYFCCQICSLHICSYHFSRNEIGATNPATSKWVVEGDRLYKKTKNAKEGGPMTPTECIYDLMTKIHQAHGHKGRDNFFNLVKPYSGSIKKAFCHQFVQVCCEKAESWQADGSVPYGWQAPVKHRKARNNAAEDDGDEETDDKAVVDNTNAANIEYPATPQAMPQDVEQFVSPLLTLQHKETYLYLLGLHEYQFRQDRRPNGRGKLPNENPRDCSY